MIWTGRSQDLNGYVQLVVDLVLFPFGYEEGHANKPITSL